MSEVLFHPRQHRLARKQYQHGIHRRGVCRPTSITRNGIASLGIFNLCLASISLISAANAGASQATSAKRSASSATLAKLQLKVVHPAMLAPDEGSYKTPRLHRPVRSAWPRAPCREPRRLPERAKNHFNPACFQSGPDQRRQARIVGLFQVMLVDPVQFFGIELRG